MSGPVAILGSIVLAAVVGTVVLGSRAVLRHVGEPRLAVSANLATAVLAVGPSIAGRFTEDIAVATGIVAILSAVAFAVAHRRTPKVDPIPSPPGGAGAASLLLSVIAFIAVSWTAIVGHYFDEDPLHYGLVGVIARGVLPPVHPLFPDLPFPYHYGFDSLAAMVLAFTKLPVEYAIDVVRIWSFALLLLTGHAIGAALGARRASLLVAIVIPLGGSLLSYLLWTGMAQLQLRWSLIPNEWLRTPVPPVIVNFFQPAVGLGMPVAGAVLLLFDGTDSSEAGRRRRVMAGSLLLGFLSLIQLVFFLVLGAALGATVLARAWKTRRAKALALELLALAGALVLAFLLGGVFAPSVDASKEIVAGRTYFRESATRTLLHHLTVMGLPLLFFPVALVRTAFKRDALRIASAAAVLVCIAVPNLLGYARDGSVMKFYVVGMVFLNVLFADLLGALVGSSKLGVRVLTVPLFILGTAIGWFWLARTTVLDGRYGIQRWRERTPPAIAVAVKAKLGPLLKPRDRVFSTNIDMSKVGFLTPGFDPKRSSGALHLLDWDKGSVLARHRYQARANLAEEDLVALGISYLVLSPGDILALSEIGKAALRDERRFEHLFIVSVGSEKRSIYRVLRPDDAQTRGAVVTSSAAPDPPSR